MNSDDDMSILEDIITDINQLITETRQTKKELKMLEEEVKQQYDTGKMNDLDFTISKERLRRHSQNIDYCLRKLEREKKIAITKIQELE